MPIFTVNAGLGIIPSDAGRPGIGCLEPTHSSGSIIVVVASTVSVVVVATTELVVEESDD